MYCHYLTCFSLWDQTFQIHPEGLSFGGHVFETPRGSGLRSEFLRSGFLTHQSFSAQYAPDCITSILVYCSKVIKMNFSRTGENRVASVIN